MYVCMSVCMYVYVHICMYTLYVCMDDICVHIHTHIQDSESLRMALQAKGEEVEKIALNMQHERTTFQV